MTTAASPATREPTEPPTARHARVKRYGYLVYLTPPLLPWLGVAGWQAFGHADLWAWLTFAYVYGLVPVLDILIGKDPNNPRESDLNDLLEDRFYRVLTYLCVPLVIASMVLGAWGLVHFDVLGPLGQIGWVVSHGLIGGALSINVAHELIHKNTRLEKRLGDILLAMACYPGFRIEHLRGHHVHVSTPEDRSSARFGQSLFHFLPRAMTGNVAAAWRLERERLERKGVPVFSLRNELLLGYALTAGIALSMLAAFGVTGLVFFLGQGFIAIVTLETVNYLEHYGLERRRLDNGRYERTDHRHSWNSNYLLTNMLLFQLQRHSDHHEFPARRYQVLRHFDDSPQLPAGYATM
ncbi:MAG: alkane 1-monooxygenase, partial [Pseudomonadota bacterium]